MVNAVEVVLARRNAVLGIHLILDGRAGTACLQRSAYERADGGQAATLCAGCDGPGWPLPQRAGGAASTTAAVALGVAEGDEDEVVAVPAEWLAGDCVTVAVVHPATVSPAALSRMIFLRILLIPVSLPLCALVPAFDPYGALHFSPESLPAVAVMIR